MKKKTLFTSFLTIVMCLCLTVGATFALFTSSSEVDISVTSGNVNVKATASELDTDIYSGSATKIGNEITVERLVPGDSFSFDIEVENYSDVAVQYRTVLSSTDGGLFTALKVTITDGAEERVYNGGYVYEDWAMLSAGDADATTAEHVKTLNVLVEFPDTGVSQNEYQGKSCTMNVLVEAVQGNASVVNPVTKINDRHYQINDAKGLMLMKGIASGMYTGEGVGCTFELTDNIDMTGYAWSPIEQMWIDFEGNGYTISNLNCGTDSWGRSGFFGYLGGGSVKNLTLENVTAEGTQVGVIAGALEGRVENVTIKGNNSVKYNRSINTQELCGGVGVVTGVAQLVPTNVVIDGNVTVDYNNLVTAAYVKNEFAQMNDISSSVTVNGNVSTSSTITRGFIANNSTELASILDYINKGMYYNISLVNDHLTIVMKAGVYTGNYHLNQWTTWNGITGGTCKTLTNDQTFVTFLGEDGVDFKGYIKVTGNGNGQGDYVGYNAETKFIKIAFDGADLPLNSNGDKYNVEVCSGANNVYFENCSFANTTHVQLGGSKHNGTGDIAFTGCKFNNAGNITGGPNSLTITNCEYNGSKNGFVSVQRGGGVCNAGTVLVKNTIVKNVEEYGFRTNALANIKVEDSTIEVAYSETAGMGSLVFFRGKDAKAEFTNCNLNYDTLVSYKNTGVDATTTSITIDGATLKDGMLLDQEGKYHVVDKNGLLSLATLVNGGNTFSGKTVILDKDINLNNINWTPIGLNGDNAGFQGTFDGNYKTIYNLTVNNSTRAYQSAGLFGSIRNATLKNFTVNGANIYNLDSISDSSNGAAVVVGSSQMASVIDNVDVFNATVTANKRVAVIAGYFQGTITNCDVDGATLTAIYDEANGSYDNCDKVGGIVAYVNTSGIISKNSVKNVTIKGYRDLGGIAGCYGTLTSNSVEKVTIIVDKSHNYKNYTTDSAYNANAIIGRLGSADDTNTSTEVQIITNA